MKELENAVIKDVLFAGSVYSPKGRRDEMTERICYGMSFCREGQITYIHNGKKYVSDSRHVVILPEGASYTIIGDKTGEFAVINFTCAEKLTDEFIVIETDGTEALYSDFEAMRRLVLFPENRLKIMSVFYGMIARLVGGYDTLPVIAPAVRYIEKSYDDQSITNEMLANMCNVSEIYLRKLFIRHLNTTPKQYLRAVRLRIAKQLLSEGTRKVSAVAQACGFSSSYNFCRFFKEKTGLSPTEYTWENKVS